MKKILNMKVKEMKAITLIALVITIVVLIILAAVAINLSLGNNGIFNRAKTAKEQYQNAEHSDQTEIAKATNEIDNYVDGTRSITEEDIKEIKRQLTEELLGEKSTTVSVKNSTYWNNMNITFKRTSNILNVYVTEFFTNKASVYNDGRYLLCAIPEGYGKPEKVQYYCQYYQTHQYVLEINPNGNVYFRIWAGGTYGAGTYFCPFSIMCIVEDD